MRLFLLLLLLAFPISEIYVLVKLFQHYGFFVLFYLVVVGYLGLRLIREEKGLFSGRMMQSIMQGGNPIAAIFSGARYMAAGVLLMIPGVITDVIAAILLLIPGQTPINSPYSGQNTQHQPSQPHQQTGDVIEGEFRREE